MRHAALALLLATLLAGCGGDDEDSGTPSRTTAREAEQPSQDPDPQALAETWWEWAGKRPDAESPVTDRTGRRCAQDQPEHVFLLAGTYGGRARRTCAVPSGRRVYVPVLNRVCEVDSDADFALEQCAEGFRDATTQLTVDGEDVAVQYVESGPFTLDPHPDSSAGGIGEVVAVSHQALLDPLEPGRHTVRFRGRTPDGFALDVRYALNVR